MRRLLYVGLLVAVGFSVYTALSHEGGWIGLSSKSIRNIDSNQFVGTAFRYSEMLVHQRTPHSNTMVEHPKAAMLKQIFDRCGMNLLVVSH